MGTYVAIGLISAVTLLLEISFLRLFAVQQFYHFAFMAVSLALLGAGASGSVLSIWRRRFSPAILCVAFALAAVGAYLTINYVPFDSFSIAWDSRQLLYLAIYFLAAAVPFFFSGLLIGGELSYAAAGDEDRTHLIYGANLIGSGIGSLSSLFVLAAVGGEGSVLVTAVLGMLAGLLFARSEEGARQTTSMKGRIATVITLLLMMLAVLILIVRPEGFSQRLSPYKTFSILRETRDARHTMSIWDATARVDVIESDTIHSMPGLSLSASVDLPTQAGLMLDGDNLMPLTSLSPDAEEAALLAVNLPVGIAFQLRPGGNTLVLDASTGMDVLWALALGAQHVTAVEENSLIVQTLRQKYGAFTHSLFKDRRVNVVNESERVFARRSGSSQYDVVVLSLNSPHRPVTSGAYSLNEDYLYTVQAVEDYLNLLEDDGFLVATRWLQTPPSESGRLFAMMAEGLANRGLDPQDHLIAFRTLRTMIILASLTPFDADTIQLVREFLAGRGFDAVYFPGIRESEVNHHNLLEDPVYYKLFQDILRDPQGTYRDYRFDIRPPTDDHPFFYHFFKWRQTPEIIASLGMTWQPFGGSGFFVLLILLVLVTLASAVLIVGPLIVWQRKGLVEEASAPHLRLRVFIYFACLGLAFLFVEIPLAQRFILMLGQPVTALAVVLFSLLIFSGLGSLTVQRWPLPRALAVLILLVALYPLLLDPLSSFVLRLPEWVRILFAVLALAPLGYFMGLPFAGGLRLVEQRQVELVPWAWAINGSFSVMSSVLAVLAALTWGFSAVLWLGAAAYGGALFVIVGPSQGDAV